MRSADPDVSGGIIEIVRVEIMLKSVVVLGIAQATPKYVKDQRELSVRSNFSKDRSESHHKDFPSDER